jgi:hypothetical protein
MNTGTIPRLGARLQAIRVKREQTQDAQAAELGVHRKTLSRWSRLDDDGEPAFPGPSSFDSDVRRIVLHNKLTEYLNVWETRLELTDG